MKRTVHHQDALTWLRETHDFSGCSFVTSLPDVSELTLSLPEWKAWFVDAASRVLSRCPDQGVTIFYQTDIKKDGVWIDKGYLCQKAAEQNGQELLWHKIVCRAQPGNITFGRPAYAHLLCFSRGLRPEIGKSMMDVLPETGEVTWTRGMGVQACRLACQFILANTDTHTVVDPFCGHGTVLAVANDLGLNAVGVELGAGRARKARVLQCSGLHLLDAPEAVQARERKN